MITIRWAAILLATVTLVALTITPRGVATAILAGFFFICFIAVGWSFGAFNTEDDMSLEAAESRLHLAEKALADADASGDVKSIRLHTFRVAKAQDNLTRARHSDERPGCTCSVCTPSSYLFDASSN